MAKKDKSEQIKELKAKGIDWAAEKLYSAREENCELRRELQGKRHAERAASMEIIAIKEENEILKNVLEENGIRPTPLVLYYHECPYECTDSPCDAYMYDECDYHCDTAHEAIEKTTWYSYRITKGRIEGITSCFEKTGLKCDKIVNEKTGEVLYGKETG